MSLSGTDDCWPEDALQHLGACPLCGQAGSCVVYRGMRDSTFRCAPGLWNFSKCAGCGCLYLDPRPSRESIGLAYRKYYTHGYDKNPARTLAGKIRVGIRNGYLNKQYGLHEWPAFAIGHLISLIFPKLKPRIDLMLREFMPPVHGESRLLDIGCGGGDFLAMAGESGWRAEGIDVDPKAARYAKARGLQVLEGEIHSIGYSDSSFDAIRLNHVIEHLYDPLEVLRACHGFLRPGGVLWVATPDVGSSAHQQMRASWYHLDPPRHLVLIHKRLLLDVLSVTGFAQVDLLSPDTRSSEEAIAVGVK